ncbi:hypothetical protein Cagg_1449 [Chloroflexus aggregans DSM 9485]|uniref:Uncharacterized protein n=1 Tax=Chloroflexus aggregans (strain MD-66 / DSM 9485) TaxID=326427 RepID=B8G966_CHLAD|nr:hypothetical protein Cagg_1449 [Chloroflexus aggregans DSM 9485]
MNQAPPEPPSFKPVEQERPAVSGPRSRDEDQRECPVCQTLMILWAGFYRCQHCGFKESCCF